MKSKMRPWDGNREKIIRQALQSFAFAPDYKDVYFPEDYQAIIRQWLRTRNVNPNYDDEMMVMNKMRICLYWYEHRAGQK